MASLRNDSNVVPSYQPYDKFAKQTRKGKYNMIRFTDLIKVYLLLIFFLKKRSF